MISIILSSYHKEYFDQFVLNVEETIGVPYEIIQIWNPGLMGICEAYNKGAEKAKYDQLVFCHEDISIKTKDWGQQLINHLSVSNVGLIGLAGAIVKTKMISSWAQGELYTRYKLVQEYKYENNAITFAYNNPKNEILSEVIALDGVFLACNKNTWQKCKFDEKLLKGFHGYDLDISLNTHISGFKNYVCYDIEMVHFSEGKVDMQWENDNYLLHKKWISHLPLSVDLIPKDDIKELEIKRYHELLARVKHYKNNPISKILYVLKLSQMYNFVFLMSNAVNYIFKKVKVNK